MTISRLDPAGSAAMSRWYDLLVAVTDFPAPSRRDHTARFDYPWPGVLEEALLARDGDRVVGAASYLLPQTENLGTAYLDLIVHPDHRRHGIGTALLEEVYAAARRHHRSLIEVETLRDGPGHRYLTNRGHRPGATSIRSRCPITGNEAAQPVAAGYSLVQWHDATPDEIVEDVAALQSRLMLDAPTGDLTVDQQRYDPARIRAQEATERGRGHRSYSTAARHDATGQIVARTKLAFESDDPTQARQRVTIVEPSHRGHRLGLTVKSANHAYARSHEPALRLVEAWNDEDNTPMRAVNATLGFQPLDTWPAFQLPVPSRSGDGTITAPF